MSYLEKLRERRKTPKAAWHKLRTSKSAEKFDFFVVFEGEEDEEFYTRYIENVMGDLSFKPIICDGKGGVLSLYDEVIGCYGNTSNIFFFIDSDHDRYLKIEEKRPQIFVTSGYSVENYLWNKDAILKAIKKYYVLNNTDPIWHKIFNRIEIDFSLFERRARFVMVYAIGLRQKDCDLDLDKINFSDLFSLGRNGLVVKKISCEDLLNKIGCQTIVSLSDYLYLVRKLKNDAIASIVRGKLISQFVSQFLINMAKCCENDLKTNGRPLKSKIQIGKKNIIHLICDFIEAPKEVDDFIKQMQAHLTKI